MIGGLNIAIAQINPVVGHVSHNAALVRAALEQCKNADLVVFPELVLCGYPPEDLVLKHAFVALCQETAKSLAAETKHLPAFILTTPWMDNGGTYNAALLIHDGAIQDVVYKKHLPNYGVFDELRVFESGPLPKPVLFKGRKLGILICEDIWFDDGARHLKELGAEIILSPNGSPFDIEKQERRLEQASARTSETGLPLVYVNQVGGQDDLIHDGGSFAMSVQGALVFEAPHFESYIGPITGGVSTGVSDPLKTIYDALKLGLKDYIAKNNFPGVIIGMSGGIDSALSAAIAADALGPGKVRCVMLPSSFTSQESFEDAEACAKALGISYEIISIEPAMKAFEQSLPGISGLAHENMQSRSRGVVLMSLSNATGWMVLTTGNKSEMAVGYATLYGDMCGGYNVLKDVYKTKVYELATWRNAQSPVIPDRILTKAPTAELREGQKDQDSLPPYDVLDSILEGLIERDLGVEELIREGHDAGTVRKILRLLDMAEYKRRQSAPGVKITPRAFGRDRRYPIVNGYRKSDGPKN